MPPKDLLSRGKKTVNSAFIRRDFMMNVVPKNIAIHQINIYIYIYYVYMCITALVLYVKEALFIIYFPSVRPCLSSALILTTTGRGVSRIKRGGGSRHIKTQSRLVVHIEIKNMKIGHFNNIFFGLSLYLRKLSARY